MHDDDDAYGRSAARPVGTAPLLPGVAQENDFITPQEERTLIERIDEADLSPFRYQQWTGKRLTCSFGWSYDFQTGKFAPTDPIPAWLLPIKGRAAHFAGLGPDDLVQACLSVMIRAPASAGTEIARCSST